MWVGKKAGNKMAESRGIKLYKPLIFSPLIRGDMLYEFETWDNNDATPSIRGGHFFKTGAVAVTVTEFIETPDAYTIKPFWVIVLVDNFAFDHEDVAFASSTKIWCPGSIDRYFNAGDLIMFLWDGTRCIMQDPTEVT